jgi:hypothetical protein
MKLKSFLLPATLALASLASVASAANVSATYNDIILGFRSTSVTAQNLEVNLGSVGQFTQASVGSTFVVANLNVADLVSVYGANWYASTTNFGLIGTSGKTGGGAVGPDGQPLSTVYVSNDVGTYASVNSSTNNNAVTKASQLYLGTLGSLSNQDNSLMSNIYTANIASATVGSWSNLGGVSGNSFANYARASFESTLGTGTSVSTTLYELLPTNGGVNTPNGTFQQAIGTFTLADTGVLTFTSNGINASAIPEPSTFAALAGAAVLGLAAFRRRLAVRA